MKKYFLKKYLFASLGILILIFGISFLYQARANGKVLGNSISRGQPIIITEDGVKKIKYVQSRELEDVFDELGIKVFPEDKVSYLISPVLGIGAPIVVRHASKVTVFDQDGKKEFRTWSETVANFFKENKIKLSKNDFVEPGMNAKLKRQTLIYITRVSEKTVAEKVSIDFDVEKRDDNSTYVGNSSVIQAGKMGEKEIKYKLVYHNNELFSKNKISEQVIKKPITKIIGIGTKRRVYSSYSGIATGTNKIGYVVSSTYARGTKIRITNQANGKQAITRVTHTWGTATPPSGVILDLNFSLMRELGYNYIDRGLQVLVEHVE